MEFQTKHEIVIQKENNTYIFSIPHQAEHGEAFDACCEAMEHVRNLLNNAADQMQEQQEHGEVAAGEDE